MGLLSRFRPVTIVKRAGQPDEERLTVQGEVQPKMGFFAATAPVYVGDVIEVPDPRGGTMRHRVASVEIYDRGPLAHMETRWGSAPPARAPSPVRRLGLDGLHPAIQVASSSLYMDGHLRQAVFEALKAIEGRVRAGTGIDASGAALMGEAFGGKEPRFRLTILEGRVGLDAHEGLALVLMGLMRGERNTGAHAGLDMEPDEALELLGTASWLMRRLDAAGLA
jgi:uncharacterized protein (TIGR02391 family)